MNHMANFKQLFSTNKSLTRHGETMHYDEGLYQVGKSAYAWMVPNGAWGETNIGLIDCNGKSVLIDTCWDLRYTREMLNGCKTITDKSPIDIVINTHSDGDHCWGNQLFKNKEIIATQACIEQIHHHPPRSINALKLLGKTALKHMPIASMKTFSGYIDEMFGAYNYNDIKVTAPTTGFVDEHVMNVNGVEIVTIQVGPGHTNGDAIVYVPEQKLAYAGDIAFINSRYRRNCSWTRPFSSARSI